MNAVAFLHQLRKRKLFLFQTREIAAMVGISNHSAGKYLDALRRHHFVEKLCKGKWVVSDSEFDIMQVAEFLTAPKESYISLHSALFYHGMIEQVPSRIYSVTVDRSKVVKTKLGVFSFHHCNPEFFIGYDYQKPYLKIATPEKALVDYFYFSPGRSRQFTKLPELEVSKSFSWKRAFDYCNFIPSLRNRTLVHRELKKIRS